MNSERESKIASINIYLKRLNDKGLEIILTSVRRLATGVKFRKEA